MTKHKSLTQTAPICNDELKRIAGAVTEAHAPELINIACTQIICSNLLQQYERHNGRSVRAMIETLTRMVDAYAQESGFSAFDLMDAQESIRRANTTMEYLAAIPSDANTTAAIWSRRAKSFR